MKQRTWLKRDLNLWPPEHWFGTLLTQLSGPKLAIIPIVITLFSGQGCQSKGIYPICQARFTPQFTWVNDRRGSLKEDVAFFQFQFIHWWIQKYVIKWLQKIFCRRKWGLYHTGKFSLKNKLRSLTFWHIAQELSDLLTTYPNGSSERAVTVFSEAVWLPLPITISIIPSFSPEAWV